MSIQPKLVITPEEYLAAERQAPTRSEYFDGEVFAMAGASYAHNLVVANVVAELRRQLKGRSCAVVPSDLRVWIEATQHFVYPDAAVICGEPVFADEHRDSLLNPTLLVEVLSESTKNYDRGEKFLHYRALASFSEYLLIAQDSCHVEHFVRQERFWKLTEHDHLEAVVTLPSIGCELALGEVYDKVLAG